MLQPVAIGTLDPQPFSRVTLLAVAFRQSSLRGRRCLEAVGVDSEGALVLLARRHGSNASLQDWEGLFSMLLTQGSPVDAQILVDAGACPGLRPRILGAWGPRVVFLP
jgi:hypothetical protein